MKASWKLVVAGALAVMALNQPAKAGVLLEPYVGYATGKAGASTKNTYTGADYGARVGYSIMGFAIGAEYMGAKFTDDATPKNNLTMGDPGLFVAFKFPVLFRAYASYFPSSKIKDESNGATSTIQKGSNMKVGVGFTGLPFININLEYMAGSYEEVNTSLGTFPLSPKVTTSGYGISISAPFTF